MGDPVSNLAQVQVPPHSSFSPRDFQSNLNVLGYGPRRVFKELHSWKVIMWRKISEIRRYLHNLHVNQNKNSIENWPATGDSGGKAPNETQEADNDQEAIHQTDQSVKEKIVSQKNNKLPTLTANLGIHKAYLPYFLKYLG